MGANSSFWCPAQLDILLLSPYDCMSHRYWRETLTRALESQLGAVVTPVTLPARFFSWRQRGNSLSFASDPLLQRHYDLLIATSMTDLSALRGMNRHVARTPGIVYFHENQFVYPDRVPEGLIERQMTSIYTALSADLVLFNSDWNRKTFLQGVTELLDKMPDAVPKGVIDHIKARSRVLPVALYDRFPLNSGSPDALDIVWNHRWEYDKGPGVLLSIVEQLLDRDVSFRMSLLGQRYMSVPDEMQRVEALLSSAGSLWHNRFIEDRNQYLRCLSEHQVVLSTANHEFQGLAVQEALLCGCRPLVPDAVVYPEYVPEGGRFITPEDAVDKLVLGLPAYDRDRLLSMRPDAVTDAWQDMIESLMS